MTQHVSPSIYSTDIVIDIQDIITVTSQLMHILSKETELLRRFRVADMGGLQDEKIKYVHYLEMAKKMIHANPILIRSFPEASIRELQQLSEIFNQVLKENHYELLKAKNTNQKILEIMYKIVRKQVDEKSGYNQKGMMGNWMFGKTGTLPALTVNNVI